MPNKNYQKGYKFELRVRDFLIEHGWYVIRSAGSKGAFDLAAIVTPKHKNFTTMPIEVVLIQCKYGTLPSKKEREKLLKLHGELGIIGICLAYSKSNDKIKFYSLKTMNEVEWMP